MSSHHNRDDTSEPSPGAVVVYQDTTNWLLSACRLQESEAVILLTPVIASTDQEPSLSDPFEILGRSLSLLHSRIRHVPYSHRFVKFATWRKGVLRLIHNTLSFSFWDVELMLVLERA
jgi:hypothetical protein